MPRIKPTLRSYAIIRNAVEQGLVRWLKHRAWKHVEAPKSWDAKEAERHVEGALADVMLELDEVVNFFDD